MFLLGVGIALYLRAKKPEQYAELGHFSLADPADETVVKEQPAMG
jgi:hypothetical protein